jgi:hypothetical protein
VLSLLIASAKTSFDTQNARIEKVTADIILVDQLLGQYGPETKAARGLLRNIANGMADRIWHENSSGITKSATFEASDAAEIFYAKIQELSPQNGAQRALQARIVQVATDLGEARLLLFAQIDNSIPMPFLMVLIFWITIIFASFSLFAEPNPIVVSSLFIFALSAACAIFLILEMGHPFSGIMQIPSAPLRSALAPLGS